MKKMNFMLCVIVVIVILIICAIIYYEKNHLVNYQRIADFKGNEIEEFYDILYTQDEVDFFEKKYDVKISLPEKFDFEHEAILICGGHELVECYYNISDEDEVFSTSHFLYVVLKQKREEKIYVYSISNKYKNWCFSQRYSENFNGITYK